MSPEFVVPAAAAVSSVSPMPTPSAPPPAAPVPPPTPPTPPTPAAPPRTLDAAGIAARVPHAGTMALLAWLVAWDDIAVDCRAHDHAGADHPLRTARGLHAAHAVEYASQAMALHGALCAERDAPGAAPRPGFLASVRALRLHAEHLDAAPAPLQVRAERQAGDARQALYAFTLADAAGRVLAEGRATVVLQGLPGAAPARAGV